MLTLGKVELEGLNSVTEPVTKEVCTPCRCLNTVGTDIVILDIGIPYVVTRSTLCILKPCVVSRKVLRIALVVFGSRLALLVKNRRSVGSYVSPASGNIKVTALSKVLKRFSY